MIRLIDIRLNAAHPELPLAEAVTYTGAPSTVLIRGVPGNCGRWCITSVYVAATFPDGSTTTRTAVQSANGVWVATLPAANTSGRTVQGVRIMADGIDENGELVSGYILGVADFAVASLGVTPAPEPGATSWQMLYFDTVPGVLRKGDVTKIDGVLKMYNGTAWEPFADLSGCVPTSRTINGKALTDNVSLSGADIPVDATPGAQKIDAAFAGKASTADATLAPRYSDTPTFSEWAVVTTPDTSGYTVRWGGDDGWVVIKPNGGWLYTGNTDANAVILPTVFDMGARVEVKASRTRTDILGYVLGSQADKPLASEAEAEALRQGKQDALTTQQLANIAAVPNKLDKSGGIADNLLICGTNEAIKFSDDLLYIYRKINGTWVAQNVWDLRTSQDGTVAFLSDVYAAVQQIAPAWVSGTAYTANALVTYYGVVYRCKADTVSPHTATPDADTTHWEAKPVSDLFLPRTGGTMTGRLDIEYLNSTGEVYLLAFAAGDAPYTLLLGFDGSRYFFFVGSAKVYLPVNAGTLAIAAPNPTADNLAALDSQGNPINSGIPKTNVATKPANPTAGNLVKTTATGELQDAGYHFEVRNGIPCIVQYT